MTKRQDPKVKAASTRENGYAEEVGISRLKANPSNPRICRDDRFAKLKKSITEFPDMLNKRPIVAVTDKDGKLMVLGGNMRLRACQDLGLKTVPVVLADDWTEEQRRRFIIADNVGFGEHDWDALESDWDVEELEDWGLSKETSALKKTYDMMNGKFDGKKMDYPVTIILDASEFRAWQKLKKQIDKKADNEAFWFMSNTYLEALNKEVK